MIKIKKISSKYSVIAIIIIFSFLWSKNLQLKKWEKSGTLISWDIIDYYCYLPASFIYKDLTMKFVDDDISFFGDKIWAKKLDNGNRVCKMSMGLSIMYMPFFLIANVATNFTGCPQTGYSSVYEFFLVFGTSIYLLVGLIFLRKILLNYYSELITAITLLSITLGTNLYYYSSYEAPMGHAYSFCLFSIFLYYTIKWHANNLTKYSIYIGFLIGLIVLIRPTNIVLSLIFIFWGVTSFNSLKSKLLLFIANWRLILTILLFALIVWLPQFTYWKYTTGNWIYYSYGKEGFFWLQPKIVDVLFSFRKGWLLYTPIMGFSILGLFIIRKKIKEMSIALPLFFAINLYIVSCWWCWWYCGYGQRPLIESYAILSLSFAAFIEYLVNKSRFFYFLLAPLLVFFIYLNIFQSEQHRLALNHWDSMTYESYFDVFLTNTPKQGFSEHLKAPNYEDAMAGEGR